MLVSTPQFNPNWIEKGRTPEVVTYVNNSEGTEFWRQQFTFSASYNMVKLVRCLFEPEIRWEWDSEIDFATHMPLIHNYQCIGKNYIRL
jgi:hypothetical protein